MDRKTPLSVEEALVAWCGDRDAERRADQPTLADPVAAYNVLLRYLVPILNKRLKRLNVCDTDVAEDLAHDILKRLSRREDLPESPRGFLVTCAKNAATSHHRKPSTRLVDVDTFHPGVENARAEVALTAEDFRAVQGALDALTSWQAAHIAQRAAGGRVTAEALRAALEFAAGERLRPPGVVDRTLRRHRQIAEDALFDDATRAYRSADWLRARLNDHGDSAMAGPRPALHDNPRAAELLSWQSELREWEHTLPLQDTSAACLELWLALILQRYRHRQALFTP